MASGKKTPKLMHNFGQQSYEYTKVDGKIESQSGFIKVEGETKSLPNKMPLTFILKGGTKPRSDI